MARKPTPQRRLEIGIEDMRALAVQVRGTPVRALVWEHGLQGIALLEEWIMELSAALERIAVTLED